MSYLYTILTHVKATRCCRRVADGERNISITHGRAESAALPGTSGASGFPSVYRRAGRTFSMEGDV